MEHAVVQTDVDRYVIVKYIAEGGMGAIYLGKKVGMGGFEKEVVLKQLLPEFTSQPEFIDLFLREARLSAALDHANIVHTIDLVAAGNDYFIVMEYVRGGDLRTILRRIKQRGFLLSPAAGIFIAREILSALAYAHEKKSADGVPLKLIHRDVSPSNVMISAAGEVKLADFGIAKASTHKSVFYRVKGKVGYMSPEQAYGDRPLDHRSDLYSLAVCLHEMLSGERLFVADLLSTPEQIYSQPVRRLEGLPGVPRGLDRVLSVALAANPDDRYQSALEFQDALVKVAYDSAMLFSAPDLATHLKEVCGEDPSSWNREELEEEEEGGDRPGTEVLSGEASGRSGESDPHQHYSGVELTSVFTGLPAELGPEPGAREPSGPSGPTRQVKVDPRGLAFEPTRLQIPSASADRAAKARRAPRFDVSDLSEPDEGSLEDPPPRWEGDGPSGSATGWRGATPGAAVAWAAEEEEQEPTVALVDGEGLSLPEPPQAFDPAALAALAGDLDRRDDATVERQLRRQNQKARAVSRDDEWVGREPSEEKPVQRADRETRNRERPARERERSTVPPGTALRKQRTLARTAEERPRAHHDPIQLTDRVRGAPIDAPGARKRNRTMMLVALVLLLLSGAIVALVGLTGPGLDDRGARPDLGLRLLTLRRDLGAASLAPPRAPDAAPPRPDRPATTPPDLQPTPAPPPDLGGKATLKVDSSPAEAAVFLKGIKQCLTPCTIEELDPEVYLLSLKRKGYVNWSRLIDAASERRPRVEAQLQEEPDPSRVGWLHVLSTPAAEVYVDGKFIGRVSSEGKIALPPGSYDISLRHPRKARRPEFQVTIVRQQTVSIRERF